MKVAVTGAGGMLAQDLIPCLRWTGWEVHGLTRTHCDVTDPDSVHRAIGDLRPDIVVQCAAFTRVDDAEAEPEAAFRVNDQGALNVVEACQRFGALFVYPSTDYAFDGRSRRPYGPSDGVNPLGVYGRSKVAGEAHARQLENHLIVRTSWLYGAGGKNFVDTILRLAAIRTDINVVADQIGLPTWTRSLSGVLVQLLKVGAKGTFHAADAGDGISWHDLAAQLVSLCRKDVEVRPVTTAEYGLPAPRPNYSVLDCSTTEQVIGASMPSREKSLAAYLLDRTP